MSEKILKKITKFISLRRIINFLLLCCLFLILSSLLVSRFYLTSYRFFKSRELVAIVECKKTLESGNPVLDIEFFPKTTKTQRRQFFFDADEWVIEGRIIQWKPIFAFFGVKNYYQIERLSGRYLDIEKEKSLPRIVYDLYGQKDDFWKFLYKAQLFIPFIEAAYGNSAFVAYEYGKKFHVYVTSSGFMIKDVTEPKKRSWWFVG